MFKYLFCSILLLLVTQSYSQSVPRSTVFSASGGFGSAGLRQLQSNMGELMADTYSNSQNFLTQGFVQPETFLITSINTNELTEAKAFPNPVSDYLFIELSTILGEDVSIELVDVLGKKQLINFNYEQASTRIKLNLEDLSTGIYFVRIISKKKQFVKIIKISKV